MILHWACDIATASYQLASYQRHPPSTATCNMILPRLSKMDRNGLALPAREPASTCICKLVLREIATTWSYIVVCKINEVLDVMHASCSNARYILAQMVRPTCRLGQLFKNINMILLTLDAGMHSSYQIYIFFLATNGTTTMSQHAQKD